MIDTRMPRFVQRSAKNAPSDRSEIAAGLLRVAAEISPKYFYDKLGSHLFEAITELPEYYPTRTEEAILEVNGQYIAKHVGVGSILVDLGAGNCEKATGHFTLL
jgi:L-histidine N-alpha-methyltransferase